MLPSEVGRAGQQVFGGLFPGDAPAQVSEGSWVQGADSNGQHLLNLAVGKMALEG